MIGLVCLIALTSAQFIGRPSVYEAPIYPQAYPGFTPFAAPVAAPFAQPVSRSPWSYPGYGEVPVDINGDGIPDVLAAPGQPIIVKVHADKNSTDADQSSNSTRRLQSDADLDAYSQVYEDLIFILEDDEALDMVAKDNFDTFDADGNGVLDDTEVAELERQTFADLGLEIEIVDDEVKQRISDYDTNADNVLSRGEFADFNHDLLVDLLDNVAEILDNPEDFDWED